MDQFYLKTQSLSALTAPLVPFMLSLSVEDVILNIYVFTFVLSIYYIQHCKKYSKHKAVYK